MHCAIIKEVMKMKKCLIMLLLLVLVLSGLFFWKGGHHAMVVSEILEEWLDADTADQSLTLQFTNAGFYVDDTADLIRPKVDQWTLTADTFWTEYADDAVFGVSAGGMTAYLREGILYMDTGRAYSLPDLSPLRSSLRRFAAGLLLHGRITKNGDTYNLTMETEELDLSASLTSDRTVQTLSVMAALPDGTAVHATLVLKAPQPHPIPQSVADAMVLAKMERPMSLSEPLEFLLPALEDLLPLSGSLELGIASGILEISETVDLSLSGEKVSLSRRGILVDLPLDLSNLSPAALGLLVLRSGTFTCQGDTMTVSLSIPGDATAQLTEALVPQAAGLGIAFQESTLMLTITGGRLVQASIAADGSVPFLFTAIPLTFSANLTVT